MKKLVSRTEFAKIANVTQGAVTRAAKTSLKEAVDGKLIDLNHESAKEFIKKNAQAKTPETIPGIDPLFEKAVKICAERGLWGQDFLKKEFSIGSTRAQKLAALLRASKVKDRVDLVIPEEKLEPKAPHVRGTAARRQQTIDSDTGKIEEDEIPPNIEIYADMTLREIYEKFGTAPRFKDWLTAMKDITVIQERQLKAAQLQGKLVSRKAVHDYVFDPINATHLKLLRDGSQTIAVRAKALVESGAEIAEIKHFVEDTMGSFIRPMKAKISRALEDLKTDLSDDGAEDV